MYAVELGSLGLFQRHMQQLWGVLAGSFVMVIMEVKYPRRARGVSDGTRRRQGVQVKKRGL